MLTGGFEGLSGVGILSGSPNCCRSTLIAFTAWLAAKCWDQHRRSRTVLLRGWLVAFLTPLLLALIPVGWRIDTSSVSVSDMAQFNMGASLLGAMLVYVTLMPAVLSLIPGVLRACLRIKALIPEAILPGLFLIAATPFYILLFLVIFTTVNQAAGNFCADLGRARAGRRAHALHAERTHLHPAAPLAGGGREDRFGAESRADDHGRRPGADRRLCLYRRRCSGVR